MDNKSIMNYPKIVAEIGINHNGDVCMAKNLIAMASNYGADFVKFQKRNPEVCVPEAQKNKVVNTKFGSMKYIDYKRKLEFSKEEYDEIDDYCKLLGIQWYASVWDIDSVDFMMQYDVPYIKIPSACITDESLLNKVRDSGKNIIISTGMSTDEQIHNAVGILNDNLEYILHTTSSYPTPDDEMNMLGIKTLYKRYQHKIGFSNHSISIIYLLQAYIMGAEMLEFHITLDRNLIGTDQYASIGPEGFEKLVRNINRINDGWGDGVLDVKPSEIPSLKKLRKYK